ncbi:uncharacterized protein GGQ97_001553 [Sphingomonas kaistensis]|uniref:Uncharacterized protein n=1 Tax=Sphingomonas kaistensis TaxID=298708 RepID=A0A7X5Y6L8_9SPHN|nr:TM0106 family RecB-like putative nuclease [Sphingomonas kaistensis]NJC05760.1 uncharacterized protein [Sphingomonas kaistensis]
MRRYNDQLLHSASDLNAFLGCSHAAALNLRKLLDPASLPDKAEDGESLVLIQNAGHAHEADYLARLKGSGLRVAEISSEGSLEERQAATLEAMREGADIVYQATFFDPPWHGFADFLRKVDTPSSIAPWSYEPIDTKLARTADPKHVLQLGIYADLMGPMLGSAPREMHLVLGDGREESFRAVEFRQTLSAAKDRYLGFIKSGAEGSVGEPCATCVFCGWRDYCGDEWVRIDHLSRVAGIAKGQIQKLRSAGIGTVADLAITPAGTRVPKLAPDTFERLRAQAKLQVARRSGDPCVEVLELEPGRGFARLPSSDPADLFFDLEGDPLFPGGLEYLWGIHYRENGKPVFKAEWAHDREAERVAFERVVDFFTEHLRAHPHAHIYHYAQYEVTVLRRLSTAFASREEAVDALLRAEKFVDLYTVARQAIRTSEPSLSLKALEIFFAKERAEAVKKADESIVQYHRWRDSKDQAVLDGILAYNRVDCENTEGLRDWLLTLKPAEAVWIGDVSQEKGDRAEADERELQLAELRKAVREQAVRLTPRARELVSHLIDFHRRASKPEWWAMFDRRDRSDDELIDDGECLGGLLADGPDWIRPEKRSTVHRYRFPDQETKLKVGDPVLIAATLEKAGTIVSLDPDAKLVEVKKGPKLADLPLAASLIPGGPLSTGVLASAVRRVAATFAEGEGSKYQALVDLLERNAPTLLGRERGLPLVAAGESLIEAATLRALAMNNTMLFIQGPPGCGKTHTSAHVILGLIASGKRVGVSSNSHKAINNLLGKIEEVAKAEGVDFSGVKKSTRAEPGTHFNGDYIVDEFSNEDVTSRGGDLVAGTAWLFADESFDQTVDYLFVDEAGQVSLGHLLAMGAAARNIILVGDQMQLGQPIQGSHPGESGLSVLDYLLEGQATIAPDRGILLDTSWRMHPDICEFISDVVYDGRLQSHRDNARQQLILTEDCHGHLQPCGVRMVEVDHNGCSQRSEAEAEQVRAIYTSLLNQRFVDRDGSEHPVGPANILVVAPYNMQVNLLKSVLPETARVGTVDKFQGQEAEVVIVSMTTSCPDDLPRHVDFFYSKNRLNVAISRARTLALVLANPRLVELDAKTVEHLRLVNTLAWLRAEKSSSARVATEFSNPTTATTKENL